jgi:cell division protein FtsW
MQKLLNKLEGDRGLWLTILLLSLISLLAVYSSTTTLALKYQGGYTEYYLLKHVLLLAGSFGLMYAFHKIDYRWLARLCNVLLAASVVLLVFTLAQGAEGEVNSANRWIDLFGLSFQPSDLAKFSLMVYLAKVLTQKQEDIRDFNKTFLPTIITVVVICGLIGPSNLSTASLLFMCSLVLMFIAGIPMRQIGGLLLVGALGIGLLFMVSKRAETWKHRLGDYYERLTNEAYVPNYQTVQSNIAISSGGIIGKGAGKSVQRNFLPQPYSDFVFAIIIEEYGLVGGVIVLFLYIYLLIRSVAIVTISKTFGALLAAGLSFLIVIQALINMGVTVGLLPVTGLPLPLISMGGTSLLFTGLALGIILNVSKRSIQELQAA